MPLITLSLAPSSAIAEISASTEGAVGATFRQFHDELERAAAAIHDSESARVVLITSPDAGFASRTLAADTPAGMLPFRCLELLPQPVLACIEGAASGIGLELAIACDMRIASTSASFAMRQVAEGAIPSAGGSQRLPRLVGRTKAAGMLLLGETFDAAAALACGLVNDVVEPGETRARAQEIAARIIARGPLAVRYAKEAIVRGLDMPLDQALRYETDLTIILQTTEDRADGVRAFLEKRAPRFEGR